MDSTYNTDHTAVRIVGDHSPHPIYVETGVVASLGGPESTYHEIKRLANRFLLPRMGSAAWPLTDRDLRYTRANEQLGLRYWRWYDLEGYPVKRDTGYDFVCGYGYADAAGAITLVNAADEPVYVIGV